MTYPNVACDYLPQAAFFLNVQYFEVRLVGCGYNYIKTYRLNS